MLENALSDTVAGVNRIRALSDTTTLPWVDMTTLICSPYNVIGSR